MKTTILGGIIGAALALSPAAAVAQVVVVSESVQEHEVAPGSSHTGRVELRNRGAEAAEVRVYLADYLFFADGRTVYPEPGSHARSNAPWVQVTPSSVVIPPGERAAIEYAVDVPVSIPPSGTHWSILMVEPIRGATSDGENPAGEPALGVQTMVRFGIQLATHVGDAEHLLDIANARVVREEDGSRHLEFEVVNEGEQGYRPEVFLELYDGTGTMVATYTEQRGLLYPGTSALQRFELNDLPEGAYQALVVVDTGAPEVFGAQFDLTAGPAG